MFRPEAVQGRRRRQQPPPTIFDLPTQFLSGVVQYLPSSSQIGSNSIALVSRGFNDLFTVNEEEDNNGAIQSPSLRQLIAEGVTSLRLDACRQARRRQRPVLVADFPRGPFPRQRLSAADYFDHGFALALDGDYFHPGDRLGQGGLQRRLTVKLDGGWADLGAAGLLDSNFNAAGQVLADTRHLATDQELGTFGPQQNIGYPWSVTAGRRRKVFEEDDLKECDDLFDEIRSTPTPGYDLTLRTADSVRRLVGTFPNVRQVTLVYTAPFFGLHSSSLIGKGNEMASPTVIPLAEAWPLLEDLRLIGRVYEGDVDVQVENQEGFDNFLKEDLKKIIRTDSSEDSSEDSSGSSSDDSSISTSSTSSSSSSSSVSSSSSSSSSSGTTPSSNSIFYYHGRRTTYENVYGSNNSSNDFNADDMEEDDRNDDDNDDDDATTIIVGEFSGEDTEDEDEGGNRNNGGDGGDGGNNLEMNVDDGGEVVVNNNNNNNNNLPNDNNPDQHFGGIPNIDNGYEGDDDYSGDDQNDQKEENSSDSKSEEEEEEKPMEEGSNEKKKDSDEDSKTSEKMDSERFEKSSESTAEMAFENDEEEEEGEGKEKEGVKVRMRLMPDTKEQSPQSPPTAVILLPAHVQAELARRTALVRSVYAPLDGLAHLRHLTTSATVEEVLTGVSPVVLRRLHSLNLVLAGDCLRHWSTATAHLSSSSATENTAHNDEFELLNGAFNPSPNDGDPPLLGSLTSLGLYLETAEYSPSIELLAVGGARVLRRLAFRDRIAPKTIQYIAEQFKHSLAYLDFAVDRYTAEVFAEPVEPVNKADKGGQDDPEVDQMDVEVSEDEGNEGSDAKRKDKEPEVGYYYSLSKLLTTLQQLSNLVELHFSYLPTEVITLSEVRTLRGRAFLKMATEKWVREVEADQLSFPGVKRLRAQFWSTLHALPHLKAVFPDAEEILFTVPVAKKGLEDSLAKLGIAFEDLLCEDYLKNPKLCSSCASAHHLFKECLRLGAKTVIISVLSKDDSNNDSSSCWALEPSTTDDEEEVKLGQVSFFLNEKNYIN